MSDYGIMPEEFPKMAQNAKDTLGVNFLNDPVMLSNEDCVAIYQNPIGKRGRRLKSFYKSRRRI